MSSNHAALISHFFCRLVMIIPGNNSFYESPSYFHDINLSFDSPVRPRFIRPKRRPYQEATMSNSASTLPVATSHSTFEIYDWLKMYECLL